MNPMTKVRDINPGVFSGLVNSYPFCTEYKRILSTAIGFGYKVPSYYQQVKQDRLIRNLKTIGIWERLDVFYIFASDGDNNFATLNWKEPRQYQISRVSSPTFTKNVGFTFNGSSNYLDTNWKPSNGVNFKQNNASAFADEQNSVSTSTILFGSAGITGTTNAFRCTPRSATGNFTYTVNDSTANNIAVASSIGFHHIRRNSASGSNSKRAFTNGATIGSNTVTSTGVSTNNMYIGALNTDGGAISFRASQTGIFGAGSSLEGYESTLYNLWNKYFTTILYA